MKLFILRHGEAQWIADTDAQRSLTTNGQMQTRMVLSDAESELRAVTRIIASPYVRAQQTARLASELLSLPVETSDLLVPEGRLEDVMAWLESLAGEVPLLVSHQPLVGRAVDWLCGLAPGRYIMGTSALAAIETDLLVADCGELRWLQQPGMSQ